MLCQEAIVLRLQFVFEGLFNVQDDGTDGQNLYFTMFF